MLLVLLLITLIFIKISRKEVKYIRSDIDFRKYLVRDLKDNQQAANMLAKIRKNLIDLTNHLVKNKDKYKEFTKYINRIDRKVHNVIISENSENSTYTSYSVNKGEQLVFCLRSKRNRDKLHDINLVMYVALHEIAHIGSPEYGHTDLFKKIFAFLTMTAIEMGMYNKMNFRIDPKEYCGLMITESIM